MGCGSSKAEIWALETVRMPQEVSSMIFYKNSVWDVFQFSRRSEGGGFTEKGGGFRFTLFPPKKRLQSLSANEALLRFSLPPYLPLCICYPRPPFLFLRSFLSPPRPLCRTYLPACVHADGQDQHVKEARCDWQSADSTRIIGQHIRYV